jgi:hypothetical protein
MKLVMMSSSMCSCDSFTTSCKSGLTVWARASEAPFQHIQPIAAQMRAVRPGEFSLLNFFTFISLLRVTRGHIILYIIPPEILQIRGRGYLRS